MMLGNEIRELEREIIGRGGQEILEHLPEHTEGTSEPYIQQLYFLHGVLKDHKPDVALWYVRNRFRNDSSIVEFVRGKVHRRYPRGVADILAAQVRKEILSSYNLPFNARPLAIITPHSQVLTTNGVLELKEYVAVVKGRTELGHPAQGRMFYRRAYEQWKVWFYYTVHFENM